MLNKVYRIDDCDLRPIVSAMGACLATDRIVDGCQVGYCYRESPESEGDTGWRFFAGDEVNTIANYDEAIVGVLDYPVGCAFRRARSGAFEPAPLLVPDATAQA
jgi:hypothetical protein